MTYTNFSAMYTNFVYTNVYKYTKMYTNFSAISSTRNRDQRITKISEKAKLKGYLLSNFHQKLIDFNLCFDNFKYKISLNSVD